MRKAYRIVGIAVALLALPARGDDWAGLGRDGGRTRLASELIASPAALGSPLATGSETAASPVAADGILVTAGLDGFVRAWREDDYSPLWSVKLGGSILSTPTIDRGRVIVPSSGGVTSVLKLADGTPLWSLSTGTSTQSSPVIAGSQLYLGLGYPQTAVSAIDMNSTAVAWNTLLEQVTNSSPALTGGLLVIGCNSGRYYALDAATGAVAWSFLTPNSAGLASPLVDGSSIYLASGSTLQRVDVDPLQWGSTNWSVTCVDPSPPGGHQGVTLAASSPVKAGNRIVFLVRFVYAFDLNGNGEADQRILREFVCGVDPVSHTIQWQNLLGSVTTPDVNGVPPFALCPTPAVMGTTLVCASSVDPALRLLAGTDGSSSGSFALDAPCLASPIVANARITAITRAGTLYVYEGSTPQPAAVTGLTPDAASFTATPSTLSWNSAGPGATYRIRIASDGEILMNWDYEFTTASTSIACPPLPTQHLHTWGVRVQGSSLACAPWSLASFVQNVPPAPPSGLSAVPKHGRVLLSWTASPSPSAVGYRLAYGPTAGVLGPAADLGNVTATTVSGLTNGTDYTFELRAVDALPDVSTPVSISAVPVSAIHIGGTAFDTIAGAMASAAPGDTVLLGADTFTIPGTVVVPVGVELRGVSALDTRILATGAFPMVDLSNGSSIALLSLSGGSVGVRVTGSAAVVRNCVVQDQSQTGVEVFGTATVVNNTLVSNVEAGLRSWGLAQVRNNIVQQNGVGLAGAFVSRYNGVSDGYSISGPGKGDRQTPVAFLDAAGGDYREQPQQASLDAGDPADDYSQEPPLNGGRINMGAFGNTALAATSLSSGAPKSSSGGGSCGLLGVEALLVLALLRRRR